MHKGYVIESFSSDFAREYAQEGRGLVEKEGCAVNQDLELYTGIDGRIDAELLTDNWFPKIKADVFISHSHLDHNLAHRLVGWLDKEFGLKAFDDSLVWGSADLLLKQIDEKHCKNPGENTYNYKKRNLSTSHVHMMLAMSIAHMIDNCECIFFLKTPSSISPEETIEDENKTSSPWIFSEIVLSKLIRQKPLPESRRERTAVIAEALESLSMESINISHPLDISHLTRISESELTNWHRDYINKNDKHPLDVLYHSTNARRLR